MKGMNPSNQEPTEENIDDFFLCGYCLEHFQREKHLLLCECPANNQKCRNGGCIRCLLKQQSIGFNEYINEANLKCISCRKSVTNQDIDQVLDAAMEAAADCCLGVRCQKPSLDHQTKIECPNKDCFNQLHSECIHSLNLILMNFHPEESIHINCPLCDCLVIDWSPPPIALVPNPIESEEEQDGESMDALVPSNIESEEEQDGEPMDTEEALDTEEPMDTEFVVLNLSSFL